MRAASDQRRSSGAVWALFSIACIACVVACATTEGRNTFISTALYGLEVSYQRGMIPKPSALGGGLVSIGDDFLVVTGEGDFYLFHWPEEPGELTIRALPYKAPINRDVFVAEHGVNWESYRFRVSDVLLRPRGEAVEIYVSHHYWKASEKCYVSRVSVRDDSLGEFLAGTSQRPWTTLYETSPCLPLWQGERGHPFGGQQEGGRMAWLDADNFLLTMGDHEYDGWNKTELFSQDPKVSYGKILAIDRSTGTSRVFSLGHRNPQGLYIDPEGSIWSTEHGPQGGDELNRIVLGANYGWPHVTYGTQYGSYVWPLSDQQGRHDGYTGSVYAWVPAIGISNLIGIEKDGFPAWKGDLLVASLVGESLYRVRIREGRVVFAEPIAIGKRIRDVIEGPDGRIVLWTDDASLVSLEPASESNNGELLYASRCASCHPALDGTTHGIGPNLWKIAGSTVASAEGYRYSEALTELGGRWTAERLDAYVADPIRLAPGTTMRTQGIREAEGRAALIEYLKTLH